MAAIQASAQVGKTKCVCVHVYQSHVFSFEIKNTFKKKAIDSKVMRNSFYLSMDFMQTAVKRKSSVTPLRLKSKLVGSIPFIGCSCVLLVILWGSLKCSKMNLGLNETFSCICKHTDCMSMLTLLMRTRTGGGGGGGVDLAACVRLA